MLLSIDPTKVEDQLRATKPSYVVTPCSVDIVSTTPPQPSGSSAFSTFSTIVAMPPDLERARSRMLALRQRLIESGKPLLSGHDLDRELDETRGRD